MTAAGPEVTVPSTEVTAPGVVMLIPGVVVIVMTPDPVVHPRNAGRVTASYLRGRSGYARPSGQHAPAGLFTSPSPPP